jgi:hypothetical protein
MHEVNTQSEPDPATIKAGESFTKEVVQLVESTEQRVQGKTEKKEQEYKKPTGQDRVGKAIGHQPLL